MTRIVLTQDGSHTLISESSKEHYHSIFGAVQESSHIFIDAGLKVVSQLSGLINILEIGMGSGLNALLSLKEVYTTNKYLINYTGIEPFPVECGIADKLNFCEYLKVPELKCAFDLMHSCKADTIIKLTDNFHFRKIITHFENFQTDIRFDLVYFDAFSPVHEPQLWTDSIFTKIHTMMNTGGILVTYCSKGDVRRSMQRCNFATERLKGPPGKHEILRATAI